nr:MAG TPA: hypothetical protein [Caudoviricetes sp.]
MFHYIVPYRKFSRNITEHHTKQKQLSNHAFTQFNSCFAGAANRA